MVGVPTASGHWSEQLAGTGCSQGYTYNDTTGALATITDLQARTVRFDTDVLGRTSALHYPGNVHDVRVYDTDSRPKSRVVTDVNAAAFLTESQSRDAAGRVASAVYVGGNVSFTYTGMGAVSGSGETSGGTLREEHYDGEGEGNRT